MEQNVDRQNDRGERRRNIIMALGGIMIALLVYLGPSLYVILSGTDATICAPGFSKAKFRQIHKGMTKAEVEHILGEPLKNDPVHVQGLMDEENTWYYAYLDHDKIPKDPRDDRVMNTWYKVREVDFDSHGRVKAVHRSTGQFE